MNGPCQTRSGGEELKTIFLKADSSAMRARGFRWRFDEFRGDGDGGGTVGAGSDRNVDGFGTEREWAAARRAVEVHTCERGEAVGIRAEFDFLLEPSGGK